MRKNKKKHTHIKIPIEELKNDNVINAVLDCGGDVIYLDKDDDNIISMFWLKLIEDDNK
jgi:hypothetical protein